MSSSGDDSPLLPSGVRTRHALSLSLSSSGVPRWMDARWIPTIADTDAALDHEYPADPNQMATPCRVITLGTRFRICSPEGDRPDPAIMALIDSARLVKEQGGTLTKADYAQNSMETVRARACDQLVMERGRDRADVPAAPGRRMRIDDKPFTAKRRRSAPGIC